MSIKLKDGNQDELVETPDPLRDEFMATVTDMMHIVYQNSKANGFWDILPEDAESYHPIYSEKIALIHSELSEALEELRHDGEPKKSEKIPHFTALEDEMADVVIRVFDLAYRLKLRLPEAIVAKHNFNITRPYKHGKKF